MGKIKIKRDDKVVVIAGEHKGSNGKVIRVIYDQNKAIIEGVNIIKKHAKPNAKNPQGGNVEKEAPIQASNVAIFNRATNKADRVGFKILEDGKKIRVFKSSGEAVDA